MTQRPIPLPDGFHVGPLFVPRKKRSPKPRMQSSHRDRVVRQRTPGWASRLKIACFYLQAATATRQTGVRHSVDHVVPLNHPLVSGLHVEHNPRVLPLAENIQKSNSHWPDMWGEQIELF